MKYATRAVEKRLFQAFGTPWITGILGSRRVGKSTLIEHFFSLHPDLTVVHFNMDKMHEREKIKAGLLEEMILTSVRRSLIPGQRVWVSIDEAQKCPELFDQIKILYDQYKDQDAIKFIVTGSALLELHRLSAESLAGRIQLFHLSAFNLSEAARLSDGIPEQSLFDLIQTEQWERSAWEQCIHAKKPYRELLQETLETLLLWGGLPEILALTDPADRLDYLASYLQTYLEKDVRAIASITDLTVYRSLMDIVAEQTGSIRDDGRIIQSLHCHRETLNKYRGYLQGTLMYQDFYPYINTSLKRLTKSPKGYLTNNGLISYLTGIYDLSILTRTGQLGHRLENWFLNELQVWLNRYPARSQIHYWRTSAGLEVDFIVHTPPHVYPFEVTAGKSIESKKVKNLLKFRDYEPKAKMAFYIYQGNFHWDKENHIIFIPAESI